MYQHTNYSFSSLRALYMERVLGKRGEEGWRNENGVSRGIAVDIMK